MTYTMALIDNVIHSFSVSLLYYGLTQRTGSEEMRVWWIDEMRKTEFDGLLSPPRVGVTRHSRSPDSGSRPDTHTRTHTHKWQRYFTWEPTAGEVPGEACVTELFASTEKQTEKRNQEKGRRIWNIMDWTNRQMRIWVNYCEAESFFLNIRPPSFFI